MSAGLKWFDIWVDVVTYELEHASDGELLSEYCDRLIDKYPTAARLVILGFGGALVLHLANVMPPQYDIISRRFPLWRHVARLGATFLVTRASIKPPTSGASEA